MILNLQYALPQILLYMCPASKMVTKFANLIKKIILKMFKTMVFFSENDWSNAMDAIVEILNELKFWRQANVFEFHIVQVKSEKKFSYIYHNVFSKYSRFSAIK